jgi:hypothetical protein
MVHKKLISTTIICLGIIVALSIFVLHNKKNSVVEQPTPIQNLSVITDSISAKDTDGDGLNDWEETIIGTDPKKADTDGDGTSDSIEISLGRDPKKAGPNDKITASNLQDLTSTTTLTAEESTITAQVSRDFFGRFLLAKKDGVKINEATAGQIAEDVISHVPVELQSKKYTKKDIKIVPENENTHSQYAEDLYLNLETKSPKLKKNEIEIISQALESQKESDLKDIDIIINAYKNIISNILKMPVPEKVVPDHIILLNTLSALHTDISEMKYILSDPIRGYIGYQHQQTDALTLKIALENISTYFKE